jgi:hypothetical protein
MEVMNMNPKGVDAYSRLILDEINTNYRHPNQNYLNQSGFKNFVDYSSRNDFNMVPTYNTAIEDQQVSALLFAIMVGIENSILTYFDKAEAKNNVKLMNHCPHEMEHLLQSFQMGGGFANKLMSNIKKKQAALKSSGIVNKYTNTLSQFERNDNAIANMQDRNDAKLDTDLGEQPSAGFSPESLPQIAKTLGLKIPDDFKLNNGEARALTEQEKESSIWSFPLNSLDLNASYAAKAFMKRILQVSDYFVARIVDFVTNNVADKPYSEVMPYMKYRTMALASYLEALSKDEEQIEALKDIARSIGSVGEQVLGVFSESAERMVGKFNATLINLVTQITEGGMKAATSIAGAIIGNIPVLGGIINLIITMGLIFNNITKIGKEMTSSFGDFLLDGIQSAKQIYAPIRESKSKILSSLQQVFLKRYGPEIYKRIGKLNVNIPSQYTYPPGASPPLPEPEYTPPIQPNEFVSYNQEGGGGKNAMKAKITKHKNRKLIKKINSTRRRLQQSLNRFHYGRSGNHIKRFTRRKV